MQPSYHLITYGCQMNQSDSERLASLLVRMGFVCVDAPEKADVVLINTCSVRQSAEDRVFGQVRKLARLKTARPELIVGVTGCLPGRDREGDIRKKMPGVDLYFPTSQAMNLPRWIGELRPELVNSDELSEDFLKITPAYQQKFRAYVTIQTGCNKFCTYCVVPFSRGLEKNRPVRDILDEVRALAQQGCVEITLLGQTVNSYIAPDPEQFSKTNPYTDAFAALLWEINQVPGVTRLHFTAPHPLHMTDQVIDALTLPAHLNFLHLPVQSGSNAVLRRMNRRYTAEQFLDVIRRVRLRVPNIAIGTDIIVGFSGETYEDFLQTVRLYEEVGFDISYTARYSVRSGTAAWRAFADDVTREQKKERWRILQELQEKTTLTKNLRYEGQTVGVLVERHQSPEVTPEMAALPGNFRERLQSLPGTCFGNSCEMKLVSFEGSKELVGKIVQVKIQEPKMWILTGKKV